jgi:hypothetical protein
VSNLRLKPSPRISVLKPKDSAISVGRFASIYRGVNDHRLSSVCRSLNNREIRL